MNGLRFILQPRYHFGESKTFFVAPEFRVKTHSFDNVLNFGNAATADTLHAYLFLERQLLIGGALVFGKQFSLSKRNGLYLELTAGLGIKHRFIKRKDIPEGYQYTGRKAWGLAPSYEEHNTGTILSSLGLRLMCGESTKIMQQYKVTNLSFPFRGSGGFSMYPIPPHFLAIH